MLFFKSNRKIVVSALLGAVLCLFPFVAFGQDAAAAEPQAWWVTVLVGMLIAFSTAIGGLLTAGVRNGMLWLDQKVKNEYLSGVIQRSTPILEELVNGTYTDFVKPLQTAGGWTASAKKEAKASVVERYKVLVGAEGIKKLGTILGAPETASEWIAGLVQAAHSKVKTAGYRAKALKKSAATADPSKG